MSTGFRRRSITLPRPRCSAPGSSATGASASARTRSVTGPDCVWGCTASERQGTSPFRLPGIAGPRSSSAPATATGIRPWPRNWGHRGWAGRRTRHRWSLMRRSSSPLRVRSFPPALRALDRGGRLVLGGIHMSPIPTIEYRDLYWERRIESVANNTRADGRAFLEEATRAEVQTRVQTFPLEQANEAPHRPQARRDQGRRGADHKWLAPGEHTGGGGQISPR